jgi:hypothetical protein
MSDSVKTTTKAEALLRSGENIFNLQNLSVLWNIANQSKLIELVKYYKNTGRLIQIRNGIYAKNANYSPLELAQKAIPLSYITGLTALNQYGMSFQYYDFTECSSLSSRKLKIGNHNLIYHKLPSIVFFNPLGLEQKEGYIIASPERAVCETLLFYPGSGIERVEELNQNKLLQIASIYQNGRLFRRIQKLIKLIE